MHPNPDLELAAPAPELAPEPAARSAHAPTTVPVPRWRRAVPLVTILPTIGLILSGLITWINVGPVDDFGARWMRAFFTALPVMPLGLLVMLAVSRLIGARLAAWHQIAGKVVLALCTACVMELLMASVVTLSNHGLTSAFGTQWVAAFVKSLPVGVLIGLLMAFLIKPRLDRWMAA
jgi:hypothetical protein